MSDADDLVDLADAWFLTVKDVPPETPILIPARDLLRLTAAVFQQQDRSVGVGARCPAETLIVESPAAPMGRCILMAGHPGPHRLE